MSFISPKILTSDSYDDECPISLENFYKLAEDGNLVETVCGHKFSKINIKEWVNSKSSCPVCVSDIYGKKLIPVVLKAADIAEDILNTEDVLPSTYSFNKNKISIEGSIQKTDEKIVLKGKFSIKDSKKISGKLYGVFNHNVLESLTVSPNTKTQKKIKKKKISKSHFIELSTKTINILTKNFTKNPLEPFIIKPTIKFSFNK